MAPRPQTFICRPPFSYFNCAHNGFSGCCTEDPCGKDWCPNFSEPATIPSIQPQAALNSDDGSAVTTSSTTASTETASSTGLSTTSGSISADSEAPSPESSANVVWVYTTSNVYVTSKATTPTVWGIAMPPKSVGVTTATVSTVSMSTETKIHTQMPTTTVTVPALAQPTTLSVSEHKESYAHLHSREIISGTVGSVVGLGVLILLVWLAIWWWRRRRAQVLRAQQFDDDPSMAGRDANKAGEYFRDQAEGPWLS